MYIDIEKNPEEAELLGVRSIPATFVIRDGKVLASRTSAVDGATLLEWLGPIADEWGEFQFGSCRLAARHSFDLNCNWKIAMEANTEVYHVRSIHPKTVAPIVDDRRNVNTLYPNGHGRMIAPPPPGGGC